MSLSDVAFFFFFNDTATTEIYTLSLHDALPISLGVTARHGHGAPAGRQDRLQERPARRASVSGRSEEHTSELQSRLHLVCRLLLEKKKTTQRNTERRAQLLYTSHVGIIRCRSNI